MELSVEQQTRILNAAREGASWTTCAHLVGISRMSLWKYRTAHPEFDGKLAAALAEWDMDVTRDAQNAIREGEYDDARALFAIRAQRIPQRYAADPKMRTDRDEMVEDQIDTGPAQAGTGFEDAVQVLLDARKEGKL